VTACTLTYLDLEVVAAEIRTDGAVGFQSNELLSDPETHVSSCHPFGNEIIPCSDRLWSHTIVIVMSWTFCRSGNRKMLTILPKR